MTISNLKKESIKNSVNFIYSKTDSLRSYLTKSVLVKLSLKTNPIWTLYPEVVLMKKKCYYPVQITPESGPRNNGICKM